MRFLKRQLQLWHRWFGIVLSVPIVLWFVSGAILLFVPYPRLLESERLAGLPPLALDEVRIGPDQAARIAGIDGVPANARLGMRGERPVWRLRDGSGGAVAVDAVDGTIAVPVDRTAAAAIARDFRSRSAGSEARPPRHDGLIDRDQWTINGLRALQPPLHRLRFDDGGVLYVSASAGEVVRDASRSQRTWGWPGAVLHWIYVTPLRANAPLWTQLVLWLSGLSLGVAVTGLGIGLWRSVEAWRRRRRISAYRGVYYWHHVLGWAGGLLVLAWLFSGFMSMSPFERPGNAAAMAWRQAWSQRPEAWPAGETRLPASARTAPDAPVEVELWWLAGRPWYRHLHRDGAIAWQHVVGDAAGTPDLEAAIAAASAASGHALHRRSALASEDVHYAGHPHRDPRALPVWRLELDDPQRTWLHVSPQRAEIVAISDRGWRLDRWLYNGLHSWDVPWLLQRPWLRYALLLAGLALGLALSLTGIVIGCRRLRALAG